MQIEQKSLDTSTSLVSAIGKRKLPDILVILRHTIQFFLSVEYKHKPLFFNTFCCCQLCFWNTKHLIKKYWLGFRQSNRVCMYGSLGI